MRTRRDATAYLDEGWRRASARSWDVSISCDTGFSASGAVLSYDASAKSDSFACTSKDDGVECWSQVTGQGFKLSRANQATKNH